jgi:hypothetical protein
MKAARCRVPPNDEESRACNSLFMIAGWGFPAPYSNEDMARREE